MDSLLPKVTEVGNVHENILNSWGKFTIIHESDIPNNDIILIDILTHKTCEICINMDGCWAEGGGAD